MKWSDRAPAQPNTEARSLWVVAAAVLVLALAIVGIYLTAWDDDAQWHWSTVIALGCLAPIAWTAWYAGFRWSLVVSLGGALAIWPVVWRGWQLSRPWGMLAALIAVSFALPTCAVLLAVRARSGRLRDAGGLEPDLEIERREQIVPVTTVCNAFRSRESLTDILHLVAQAIREATGFERLLIGVAEGEPLVLRVGAVAGFAPSIRQDLLRLEYPLSAVQDAVLETGCADQLVSVSLQGAPAWVESLSQCWFNSDVVAQQGGGFVLAPMVSADHGLLGVLIVDQPGDGQTDKLASLDTLQMLAQQTGMSLDNYRLRSDVQRRIENLSLVNKVGRTIASGLDSASILRELVDASMQLSDSRYSVLFSWDEDREQLVPQMSRSSVTGDGKPSLEHRFAEIAVRAVREGRSLIVADMESDPGLADLPPSELGLRSALVVPLVEGRKVGAVLGVGSTRSRAFDSTDQVLLSTLADQASVSIQNARLYESAILRADQLATLNDLGKTVISSLDMNTALDLIMNRVEEAFGVESGSLLLLEKGKLVFRVSFGPVGEKIKPLTLELGQGIAGWVALTGVSVLLSDVKGDQRHWARFDEITSYETRSLLCVPLKGPENQVIGVLELINPLGRYAFTEQDQELLESIATFAVIAIQNAQLYQQTLDHVDDLSSLYEVGKAITSTLDIQETLQMTASEAALLTRASKSQIVLIDRRDRRVMHAAQHGHDANPRSIDDYDQVCQGISGWVLAEKAPTLAANVYDDERLRGVSLEHHAGRDARSIIAAPVLIKGEAVGVLEAIRTVNTEPFTERELGLLNMLAGQASIAIENAHFFEERRRQITELSILNQTGQALSSTLELADMIELIYSQVARVMDAQNFYIALYDPADQIIRFPLVYEHGVRLAGPGLETSMPEWLPRRSRKGLTEYILQNKRHVWFPNQVQERLAELGLERIGAIARSWLGVPILADEQVLGVIAVQSYDRENVYDREHLDLLTTIASQASAQLRKAQLFAELNHMAENLELLVAERTEALAQANQELVVERDRLNALYRVTSELARSLTLERALNRALVLINDALGAQQGYILIQDSESEHLTYVAMTGETAPSAEGEAFPSPQVGDRVNYRQDEGLIGWLALHPESICVNDLQINERWQILEDQGRWHRSALAAPLLSGFEVVGAILLYHRESAYFTEDHQRMLDAIASQVAVVVSNIEMFRLLREAADRLGNMVRAHQLEAAKSHAILEGVADGVMVTDAQGEITWFNAAAERILQSSRADVIGQPVSEMPGILNLAGTSWPQLVERWGAGDIGSDQEILHEGQLVLGERVISIHIAPVIRQGEFEGTVSVFRDITREVEVDRMKSEFVSSVSHELRTPMTSIKGYIDLLHGGMAGELSNGQKQFLQIVKNNTDRLILLVNDLLDISGLQSGKVKLAFEPVDPVAVVDEVLTALAPDAAERHQVLESRIAEPLPCVRADPHRMIQILTNLCKNAIKYTPTGGQVLVDAKVVEKSVHFHVMDNGIGISEEDQKKLFNRFFRADNPLVQSSSGTGLGLPIVKSIVELHGGEIWFKSALGEGSMFSFSLPLATQDVRPAAGREFRTISYRPQDKRILIVGDETERANVIAHQLRNEGGYRVQVVSSGRDALDQLGGDRRSVDLIALNLRLPDMNGLEATQRLRGIKSLADVPMVLLAVLHRRQSGHWLDAEMLLCEPIEAGQLMSAVDQALTTGATALLVESDQALISLLQSELGERGYRVFVCDDERQTIDAARTRKPGLILLDLKSSGPSGFETLRALRDAPEAEGIPVILISKGLANVEDETQRLLGIDAARMAARSLSIDELVAVIRAALNDDASQ